jgi:hypothetical protein
VVIPFKKGKGNAREAVQQLVADKAAKGLQAVFVSTNNLTYTAGGALFVCDHSFRACASAGARMLALHKRTSHCQRTLCTRCCCCPRRCCCAHAEFLEVARAASLGLPIFGGDALSDTGLAAKVRGVPSAIDALVLTTTNKGKNSFIKRFRAQFPAVSYEGHAAQAYDAMVALLRALGASSGADGPGDAAALGAALQQQRFEGEGALRARGVRHSVQGPGICLGS